MQVKEVMTEQMETLHPQASITEAAKTMQKLNVGVMPVRKDSKAVGLLTDRDIVTRVIAEDKQPGATSVNDVMTKELACCSPDDDLEQATNQMREKQLRRLIVCDAKDNAIGILSLGDIAAKTGDDELAGAALEDISEPAQPKR